MKKIVLFIALLLTSIASFSQVKVLGRIVPNGLLDAYPTTQDSTGYGGFRIVADATERNAITLQRRKTDMVVIQQSDHKLYRLNGAISGNDWQEVGASFTEIDPIYSASSWFGTANNASNWNTAYSWGNHSSAGYLLSTTAATTYYPLTGNPSGFLTSYSEADPIYLASSWYSTTNNSSNWNTAFAWGNHASVGYLLSSAAATTYYPLSSNPYGYLTTTTGDARYFQLTNTLGYTKGGTGLSILGSVGQQLRVNAGGTALEYFTPSASGSVWGSITGALSDQTDLQTALNNKISTIGQPKSVQYYDALGNAARDSTKLKFNPTTNSLYVNVNTNPTAAGSISSFGNSITAGTGASSSANKWTAVLSALLGTTDSNFGLSGSTLQKRAPIDYGGATNMVDRVANIPTYVSGTTKWLIFCYGINDWRYAGGSYSSTNFITDYTTVLNYAITTKGWPANKILLTNIPYVSPSVYVSGAAFGTPTQATLDAYNAAVVSLSSSFGTLYADIATAMRNHGAANLFNSDKLHPNDAGHKIIALTIAQVLKDPVTIAGQAIASNGVTEAQSLKIKNYNLVSETNSTLAGIDSAGNVSSINVIPSYTRHLGNQMFTGQYIPTGVTYPTVYTLGAQDILMRTGTNIVGAYDANSTYTNRIETTDANASMNFTVGYTSGQFNVYTGGAAVGTPSFKVNQYKQITLGNANTGRNNNYDIWVPFSSWFGSYAASAYGAFEPMDGAISTNTRNSYTTGSISDYVSGGTTGNQVLVRKTFASGRVQIQPATVTPTYTDIPSAALAVNSTTMGLLAPRMTKTQRDAISSPATGLIIYQTDNTPGLRVYNGTNWMRFTETID